MKLFGISDLHLSFSSPKPMEMFGTKWKRHHEKIRNNWNKTVSKSDIVLIPGDISWSLKLKDALPDIDFIMVLPTAGNVPPETHFIHEYDAILRNTTKPIVFTAPGRRHVARFFIQM